MLYYTDNSSLSKSCEYLNGNHGESTRQRTETNGIGERAVRRIKEGTLALMVQFGPHKKLVEKSYGMPTVI